MHAVISIADAAAAAAAAAITPATQTKPQDRILFVRTSNILETMVKAYFLIASVIIAAAAIIPAQYSFGSPRELDLIVYPDGSTHVLSEFDVDPLDTDYQLDLFGGNIDNFVTVGESGFLLASKVTGNSALIETFGSSVITAEYDIHDLVSKQGRIWTFTLDAPADFTLLLPQNSVIVTMTNLPISMETVNDHNKLTLPGGQTEIDYIFSTVVVPRDPPSNTPDVIPPPSVLPASSQLDYVTYAVIGIVVTVLAVVVIFTVTRKKQDIVKQLPEQPTKTITAPPPPPPQPKEKISIETIFKLKPDMRDDDKDIVKFIFDNGGEALESELRKKFLQPRTTMWRAVKRLERNDIVYTEKKDSQNLVKLHKDMKGEEQQ